MCLPRNWGLCCAVIDNLTDIRSLHGKYLAWRHSPKSKSCRQEITKRRTWGLTWTWLLWDLKSKIIKSQVLTWLSPETIKKKKPRDSDRRDTCCQKPNWNMHEKNFVSTFNAALKGKYQMLCFYHGLHAEAVKSCSSHIVLRWRKKSQTLVCQTWASETKTNKKMHGFNMYALFLS